MNNKLIFRILGAISSALIAVSVFLPYVSVTGYSENLWNSYQVTNTLYLPIMIIVFGVIGVIFFALNIKTEFAYATAGAVLFFVVMRTFDIANQGTFNTLGVGYYFMAIGSVLTGVMAFLCNMGPKKIKTVSVAVENNPVENQTLNKINDLSSIQNTVEENITPVQPINNIEPVSMNPIPEQAISPIQEQPIQSIPEPEVSPIPEISVVQEQPVMPIPDTNIAPEIVEPIQKIEPQVNMNNPVVRDIQPEVTAQQPVNPVIEQFAEKPANPVVQEFMVNNSQPNMSVNNVQPVLEQNINTVPLNSINEPAKVNPVVQEFTNPNQGLQINQNTTNNNETDIFGQPINK